MVTLQPAHQGAPIFLLFAQAPPPFASSSHVALSEKFGIKVHQFTLVDLLLGLYWTTFATIQPFGQKIVLSHLKLTSEMFLSLHIEVELMRESEADNMSILALQKLFLVHK